ncbi:MAG TPA: S41 family peptidase [Aggregatilineales bacterium]|nr:S41 family peptidase [Aggregatilineales bacterium]
MRKYLLTAITVVLCLTALVPVAQAQGTASLSLSGKYNGGDSGYDSMPFVVALADASGILGNDPVYEAPPAQQILAKTDGTATRGSYSLTLPAKPTGRALKDSPNVLAFDVRLMSDAGKHGYLMPNEDIVSSSLKLDVDYTPQGGRLLLWAPDASEHFGMDSAFPAVVLPSGWSVLELDSRQIVPLTAVDLYPTDFAQTIDYQQLSCAVLIPTFLDRVQKYYPFTDLKHIDWTALRAKLIPESKTAQTNADCQRIIREFGNAIPDGHVDFSLPALLGDWAGSAGLTLAPTSEGKIVVYLVRPLSAANLAGIKPGAEISAWDGLPIDQALTKVTLQSLNSGTAHGLLNVRLQLLPRGPLGSQVKVTFQNPGEPATTATLIRDLPQPIRSGKAPITVQNHKLPSGDGYFRISGFSDGRLVDQFDTVIDQLIQENAPAIILDIRSNPGGWSQVSDALAGRFFERAFLVGTTVANGNRTIAEELANPRPPIYKGCVLILVDVNSASAADIFSYTFKASQRGLIVGHTPSAGMAGTPSGGMYNLPGGAFIQVPTGGLIDATGKTIVEGVGTVPDILVPQTVQSLLSPDDDVLAAAEAAVSSCKVNQ